MVFLRAMSEKEFPNYCQYFIEDYSQEIAKNYGHSLAHATRLAEEDLQRCFPHGLESNEHTLLCIDADIDGTATLAGYLWHSVNLKERSTFIYDFYIFPKCRSHGIGKQAIAALEHQLQAESISQIKLRVAYHNERALKLYKEVGFVITGFNVAKEI